MVLLVRYSRPTTGSRSVSKSTPVEKERYSYYKYNNVTIIKVIKDIESDSGGTGADFHGSRPCFTQEPNYE